MYDVPKNSTTHFQLLYRKNGTRRAIDPRWHALFRFPTVTGSGPRKRDIHRTAAPDLGSIITRDTVWHNKLYGQATVITRVTTAVEIPEIVHPLPLSPWMPACNRLQAHIIHDKEKVISQSIPSSDSGAGAIYTSRSTTPSLDPPCILSSVLKDEQPPSLCGAPSCSETTWTVSSMRSS